MNKNIEMMKKLIEQKNSKGKQKGKKIIPDRYGNQSNGSGKLSTNSYGK
ncbi:hypothetical protein [Clostridium tarantellae]|nr:hypothetical protein [Clostridium tarantellae]